MVQGILLFKLEILHCTSTTNLILFHRKVHMFQKHNNLDFMDNLLKQNNRKITKI